MNEEMRVEAMELCVTACEKHTSSNEVSNNNTTIKCMIIIVEVLCEADQHKYNYTRTL